MSLRSSNKFSLLLGAVLLVSLAVPASFAAGGNGLEIVGHRISATAVAVTVVNSDDVQRAGTLVVTVRVGDDYQQVSVQVKVQPNASQVAVVSFGSPVDGVIVMGISDDPHPV